MTLQGMHHTSFTVSELTEAKRFFVELLGMVVIGGGRYDFDYVRRQVGFPEAELNIAVLAFSGHPEGGHLLELIQYVAPAGEPVDTSTNRPGNAHLCFVVSDVAAEMRRLQGLGVRFTSATPNEVTWGINRGAQAVYFRGPDGIALELFQPAPQARRMPE